MTVAALFVRADGPYTGLWAWDAGVDPWTEGRDARSYVGPWPVVAHPPCQRWGNLWHTARHLGRGLGDDDGCFASAVASVRRWGGVLEHPSGSRAWPVFGMPSPPTGGGWTDADVHGGRCAEVYQRNYGHRALKRTWLYYVGRRSPPELNWSPPPSPLAWACEPPLRRDLPVGVQVQGRRERETTPDAVARLLVALASESGGAPP